MPVQPAVRVLIGFMLAAVLVASRWLALAASPFDWDEAQFVLGVIDYDVVVHRPHPPGYPLFVALAKLLANAGMTPFHALQALALAATLACAPAAYLVARELEFGRVAASCAALTFLFVPNVWTYGGSAFGDLPATALLLLAIFACLAARRSPRALLWAGLVLGLTAAIRPAHLLLALLPMALAVVANRERPLYVLAAVTALIAIAATAYLAAAAVSGSFEAYWTALEAQSRWLREVDSWRGPSRPSLPIVGWLMFVEPVGRDPALWMLLLLALYGTYSAMRRRDWTALGIAIAMAPFAIFMWLNLAVEAAARYAIPLMAGYALLATLGARSLWPQRSWVVPVVTAAIVATSAVASLPGLIARHDEDSPPVQALFWAAEQAGGGNVVWVPDSIARTAAVVLSNRPYRVYSWQDAPQASPGDLVVTLGIVRGAQQFRWPRTDLRWRVLRRSNFEFSVSRAGDSVDFGAGWYGPENDGELRWRWMGREASLMVPGGDAPSSLHFRVNVVGELAETLELSLLLDGQPVARVTPGPGWTDVEVSLPASKLPRTLRLETNAAVVPAQARTNSIDTRTLSLRITDLRLH